MSAERQFLFEVVGGAPDGDRCEAVLAAPQCPVRQLATLARLVGPEALVDADLGRLWGCVVVCSPEFAAHARSRVALDTPPPRPPSVRIFLLRS